MQKSASVRRASSPELQEIRLHRRIGAKTKLSKGSAFKAALKLIGPSPLNVAALIWQKGWRALERIAPDSNSWDVSVIAAAILTLSERRPGMEEFWEDYRDQVLGWPTLLATATGDRDIRSRSWERRVELALYVTRAYCAHRSDRRMTIAKLLEQRESLPKYRLQALESTFLGLPKRMAQAVKAPKKTYEYKRIRVRTGDGQATTVSLELELYADVCLAIGRKTVHRVARAVAAAYRRSQETMTLSGVVQQELMALVRENLDGARVMGVQDAGRFIAGDPRAREYRVPRTKPVREMTYQERRAKYGTSYGKTYFSVNVGAVVGRSKPTCVSVGKALLEKACSVLTRSEVNALIRRSAQGYSADSRLSLSEYARESFLYQLCQLPQATELRM